MDAGSETSLEAVSEQGSSADEVGSVTRYSESTHGDTIAEVSVFIEKISPVIDEIKELKERESEAIQKAIESLEVEYNRTKDLISSVNFRSSPVKYIEDVTQNLGRSLGLVLFAGHEVSIGNRGKIDALRKEMMNIRFNLSSERDSEMINTGFDLSLERESEFAIDVDTEGDTEQESIVGIVQVEEEEEDDGITLDVRDVVFKLSCGNDEEFRTALMALDILIRDNMITNERIDDESVVSNLCNRLRSGKSNDRLAIIKVLRSLIRKNVENKEKMADVGFLSVLVKSLTRDAEERREAVGLLSSLSDIAAVRRRIGRIQGCIVMLVSIFNGEDEVASDDGGRLLNSLSSNSQYVLNMAEAGYFKPLVHYLKEGSEMSKILMATALSKMELTDQSKASLGEDGAIEPLVRMFTKGNLEARLAALNALQNITSIKENIQRLISCGIVVPLLQLLFSVTSVLMILREPAAAILAMIAQSESILVKSDVSQQMLSLLNLTSPVIQCHLLAALNSIAANRNAIKVRKKMKDNGAIQLLLAFLEDGNSKIRTGALQLIFTLSKEETEDLAQQLGEANIIKIVSIISSSTSEEEKAAAIGILSNLPVGDKKTTDIVKSTNLLPILVSVVGGSSNSTKATLQLLSESIAGVLLRFTSDSNKNLQRLSAEHGAISTLVKLLSNSSTLAKSRAATCLAQLSQSSHSLSKSRKSRWFCMPPPVETICEVHEGYCSVKSTYCLVKADAVPHLIRILESREEEAYEAALSALATLLQEQVLENGSNYLEKFSGIKAIVNILETGSTKAKEKSLWMLERIFSVEEHRLEHGPSAQLLLIDLAQHGDTKLKPMTAKLLAQLELLQSQSSYF